MIKKTSSKSDSSVDKSNAKMFYLGKPILVPYANSLINNRNTVSNNHIDSTSTSLSSPKTHKK